MAEILPDFVIREHFSCLTISHFFMYGLVHFCWPLKNLLALIYSKLLSKSCDNLYNSTWFLIYVGLLVSYIFIARLKVELPFSSPCEQSLFYLFPSFMEKKALHKSSPSFEVAVAPVLGLVKPVYSRETGFSSASINFWEKPMIETESAGSK